MTQQLSRLMPVRYELRTGVNGVQYGAFTTVGVATEYYVKDQRQARKFLDMLVQVQTIGLQNRHDVGRKVETSGLADKVEALLVVDRDRVTGEDFGFFITNAGPASSDEIFFDQQTGSAQLAKAVEGEKQIIPTRIAAVLQNLLAQSYLPEAAKPRLVVDCKDGVLIAYIRLSGGRRTPYVLARDAGILIVGQLYAFGLITRVERNDLEDSLDISGLPVNTVAFIRSQVQQSVQDIKAIVGEIESVLRVSGDDVDAQIEVVVDEDVASDNSIQKVGGSVNRPVTPPPAPPRHRDARSPEASNATCAAPTASRGEPIPAGPPSQDAGGSSSNSV